MKRKRPRLSIIFLSISFFVLAIPTQFYGGLKLGSLDIVKAPLAFVRNLGKDINDIFFSDARLKDRMSHEKQITMLKARLSAMQQLQRENARLRELLNLKRRTGRRAYAAEVVGRDMSAFTQTVVIDKGRRDFIREDMVVLSRNGSLIGRVSEVGSSFSRVVLINDPNSRVSAVAEAARSEGIIEGVLSGALRMKHIASDESPKIGEHIFTSGLGNVFPKGILIGTIDKLYADRSGLYRCAVIKPSAELSKVEEVLILQ